MREIEIADTMKSFPTETQSTNLWEGLPTEMQVLIVRHACDEENSFYKNILSLASVSKHMRSSVVPLVMKEVSQLNTQLNLTKKKIQETASNIKEMDNLFKKTIAKDHPIPLTSAEQKLWHDYAIIERDVKESKKIQEAALKAADLANHADSNLSQSFFETYRFYQKIQNLLTAAKKDYLDKVTSIYEECLKLLIDNNLKL
jgi:cysteinyl-tRNA synthetase